MVDVLLVIFILMLIIISYQIYSLTKLTNIGVVLMATIQEVVTALTTSVTNNTTVIGSVEQLLTNLTALIADLKTQLANAGVDPAIIAQVQALQTALDTKDAELAAAVVTNTPASGGAVGSAPVGVRPASKPIDQK
jgi:Flp pilus assembly pilin Flp